MKKYLVICHGDGDGIISTAALIKQYQLFLRETEIVITQSFFLDEVFVRPEIKAIFVIDIAVNKRDIALTTSFANKHKDKIISWVNHHRGTEKTLGEILGIKLLCNENSPSSPAVMKQSGYDIAEEWVAAANAINDPENFPATELSERYTNAFKTALVDAQDGGQNVIKKLQLSFIDELLTSEKSRLVANYSNEYKFIVAATNRAAELFIDLMPKVGMTILGDEKVDKIMLCRKGHEKFKTVVIQFHSLEDGEPATMISTELQNINLAKKFKSSFGSPSRITLPGNLLKTRELIIEKLS